MVEKKKRSSDKRVKVIAASDATYLEGEEEEEEEIR